VGEDGVSWFWFVQPVLEDHILRAVYDFTDAVTVRFRAVIGCRKVNQIEGRAIIKDHVDKISFSPYSFVDCDACITGAKVLSHFSYLPMWREFSAIFHISRCGEVLTHTLRAKDSLAMVTLQAMRPAEPNSAFAAIGKHRIGTRLFSRWGHEKRLFAAGTHQTLAGFALNFLVGLRINAVHYFKDGLNFSVNDYSEVLWKNRLVEY
jgi:hypothetical protein